MSSNHPIASSTTKTTSTLQELAAILAGAIGGARYGLKIRAPHALVMTLLFRRHLSWRQQLESIVRISLEHATNLASFAAIYKTVLALLKWASRYYHDKLSSSGSKSFGQFLGKTLLSLIVNSPLELFQETKVPIQPSPPGFPERSYHAVIAGTIGGYFCWGKETSVNKQILLYLSSRVVIGLCKRLWRCRVEGEDTAVAAVDSSLLASSSSSSSLFPIVAALTWGCVLALYEDAPEVLQSSLRSSMDEIYRYNAVHC